MPKGYPKNPINRRFIRNCKQCGKEFSDKLSHNFRKFCSMECYGINRRGRKVPEKIKNILRIKMLGNSYSKGMKKTKQQKETLKRRKPVVCTCGAKRIAKDRSKYGTGICDGYSFSFSGMTILANGLFQYVADGRERIIREDWDIILKHAQAIMDYAEADSWDRMTTCDFEKSAMTRMIEYGEKELKFEEAMFWLTKNIKSLWW